MKVQLLAQKKGNPATRIRAKVRQGFGCGAGFDSSRQRNSVQIARAMEDAPGNSCYSYIPVHIRYASLVSERLLRYPGTFVGHSAKLVHLRRLSVLPPQNNAPQRLRLDAHRPTQSRARRRAK